jgi:hypothetical protein
LCSDLKGTFSASVYRPKYQNYVERISARILAKKLNLNNLYLRVMEETEKAGGMYLKSKLVLDKDELEDW